MAAIGHRICEESGKRGYPSKHQARRAMRKAGNRVAFYLCQCCHLWHVTDLEKGR